MSKECLNLGRRQIVVALDGSSESQKALEFTLKNIVCPMQDHIILLSVCIHPQGLFQPLNASFLQEFETRSREFTNECLSKASATLEEYAQNQAYDLEHEIICFTKGDPRELIVNFCAEINANLLIVGSRGLNAFKR
jgi:nucleotide-binding universal stress UspA family protein